MSSDRAKRIKMLQWYTLGEYRLYFVRLEEYYVRIFDRYKPTDEPMASMSATTMKELVKKVDDYCIKWSWKTFRYRLEEHIWTWHPYMLRDMNQSLVNYPIYPVLSSKKSEKAIKRANKEMKNRQKKVCKELDCMSEKVKIWSELYESLKQQRILSVLGIMLSALVVALLLWK